VKTVDKNDIMYSIIMLHRK